MSSAADSSAASADKSGTTPSKDSQPALTPAEFKHYNRLADHMDYFHTHFRHSWKLLHESCTSGTRPQGMSIRQFLQLGLQLISQLETHHSIEEHYVFPVLAKKMPAFRDREKLIGQHRQIHKGLEALEKYLEACRSGERELVMSELKGVMDGFGEVLWTHLDEEVAELGAQNMRKYWNKEEMGRLQL